MGNYTAGCLCGAVRVEARGEPLRVGICHCMDCRKHHGAIFGTFAIYAADAITVTGTTSSYARRHFCPTCGSSVFARTGDEIDLPLGSLDAPNQFAPTYELWVRRRENWLPSFDTAHLYDGDRPPSGPTGA